MYISETTWPIELKLSAEATPDFNFGGSCTYNMSFEIPVNLVIIEYYNKGIKNLTLISRWVALSWSSLTVIVIRGNIPRRLIKNEIVWGHWEELFCLGTKPIIGQPLGNSLRSSIIGASCSDSIWSRKC